MQISPGLSRASRPFWEMTKIPLTFPPVLHPPRGLVLPHLCGIDTVQKKTTLRTQQPTSSYSGFTPHQSPPSMSDLANHRNLALQLHMPCISLLKFKIFLCLWALVKFCPMIMRLVAHNLQTFWPTVLTRLMVFERHRMSNVMLVRHHFATSALVLNWRFFTWAKSWRASAEQLSCCASRFVVALA